MFELIFIVVIPTLLAGFGVGRVVERRHLSRLSEREAALSGMVMTNTRRFPGGADALSGATMVTAEAVISPDYFVAFMARLRGIIGGEVRSYQRVMERARRETLLRLMEQARHLGFDAVCNVRLDTADIAGTQQRAAGIAIVCILGSATAYRSSGAPPGQDHGTGGAPGPYHPR